MIPFGLKLSLGGPASKLWGTIVMLAVLVQAGSISKRVTDQGALTPPEAGCAIGCILTLAAFGLGGQYILSATAGLKKMGRRGPITELLKKHVLCEYGLLSLHAVALFALAWTSASAPLYFAAWFLALAMVNIFWLLRKSIAFMDVLLVVLRRERRNSRKTPMASAARDATGLKKPRSGEDRAARSGLVDNLRTCVGAMHVWIGLNAVCGLVIAAFIGMKAQSPLLADELLTQCVPWLNVTRGLLDFVLCRAFYSEILLERYNAAGGVSSSGED